MQSQEKSLGQLLYEFLKIAQEINSQEKEEESE
jgi:hypothetical protein